MTLAVRLSLLAPVLVAASAGCVSGEAPDEGTASQAICTQVARAGGVTANTACSYPWVGQQGTLLQGEAPADVRYAVPSDTTVHATVDSVGHILVRDGGGNLLPDGYLLAKPFNTTAIDGSTTQVQISTIYTPNNDPADPNYGRFQYLVTQADGTPLCTDPGSVLPQLLPLATPIRAIATAGRWQITGTYDPLFTGLSFACRTGVAAKCDRWGYGPNTTWPKQTAHNNPISVSGADVYQTCTRMARADYCAQAVPNTIDGTPIYIEDNFHLRGTQPGYVFEAAWRDNAWADGKTVTGKQVICLSKLRWATLPLGGNCPLTVPDPRVSRKGRFCDDMTDADFDNAGAVMFSSSALIDTGLATYSDATTGQHLTTTKLQPQTEGQVPQWTISPPADLHFPTHTQPTDTPRFEATLLRTQLPEGFDTSGLVKLNSYDCGGSPVTTTTQPDGCAPLAEEGYVYATALDRAPLRRWRNRTTGQSWTTVTSPTTMWSQGVDLVEVIGGVVRASLDVNVRWTAVPGTSYALDVQLRTGEWIPHCIDAATLGNAVSVAFTGVCTGMANRQINHSDIAQFRMSYDGHYANQVYDGFASDVYIAATNVQPPLTAAQIKGSQPTALSFSWKDVGNATYVISLSSSAGSCKVAVANDTAFVYTGTCPAGGVLPARVMRGVTLCAYDKASGTSLGCTETKLDGKTATWPLTFTP